MHLTRRCFIPFAMLVALTLVISPSTSKIVCAVTIPKGLKKFPRAADVWKASIQAISKVLCTAQRSVCDMHGYNHILTRGIIT